GLHAFGKRTSTIRARMLADAGEPPYNSPTERAGLFWPRTGHRRGLTVNNKWKARFGREAFRQFILRLLALQADNGGLSGRDRPIPPQQAVSRHEMLDRFLNSRPEFEPFRKELANVYDVLPEFRVNNILWQELAAG